MQQLAAGTAVLRTSCSVASSSSARDLIMESSFTVVLLVTVLHQNEKKKTLTIKINIEVSRTYMNVKILINREELIHGKNLFH